jgi:hypothetical protein
LKICFKYKIAVKIDPYPAKIVFVTYHCPRKPRYLPKHLKIFALVPFVAAVWMHANGQLAVSGTVYDSTKTIPIKDVVIKSSSGIITMTDSAGHYTIAVGESDSLIFIYNYRPTAKFAIKKIEDPSNFDIALHVRMVEKFKTLKEVRVYAKSYKQDSLENREQYKNIFSYRRPGISTNTDSYTGAAGLDINELINIFRFKRNRQLRRMQERLMEEEKEHYISYRFNKALVRRITHFDGKDLEIFMKEYRPDFEFTENSSLVDFYQYILNASYQYKRLTTVQQKKE